MSHAMSHANRHALDNDQARSAPLTPTPHISPSSGAGEAVKLTVKLSTISADIAREPRPAIMTRCDNRSVSVSDLIDALMFVKGLG